MTTKEAAAGGSCEGTVKKMKDLDKDNYDSEVIEKGDLYLVDFWSETCEDCMEIMPEIEKLEKEYSDRISFGKVNIKGNRRLAIREKVLGLPAIVIYKNGSQTASFSKEIDPSEVRSKLEEILVT